MTIPEATKLALDVQDACNLSGVVRSYSAILSDVLWPEARRIGAGADWVNRHPIAILFADKVAHLTGTQGYDEGRERRISEAYAVAHALASDIPEA